MRARVTLGVALVLASTIQVAATKEQKPSAPHADGIRLVFGVSPGRPIADYPDCDAPEGIEKTCVHTISKRDVATGEATYFVELRPQRPSFLAANLTVFVRDGTISAVAADTTGLKGHAAAWDRLTLLLGNRPTELERTPVQNQMGAKFERIEATWQTSAGSLTYKSMEDRLDRGSILIVGP